MPKLIRDTGEACRPYSLNLPESYAALFASITSNGASNACRLLISYALEHGALEALAAKPAPARELTDDELRALPLHMLTAEQAESLYGE